MRTPVRGGPCGCSDGPDVGGVPVRREPADADARRWPAAVREARGRCRATTCAEIYEQMSRGRRDRPAVPQAADRAASPRAGQWVWTRGRPTSTSSTTSGTARCPSRVGSASCSTSARRLHSTRLARERPLWEAHLIEGLRDGRVALYTKMHHSLVDGISAMRLLQSVMTTDPDKRDMPADVGGPAQPEDREGPATRPSTAWPPYPSTPCVRRSASPPTPPALPAALVKTLKHGLQQRDLGALALRAAHDLQHHDHRLTPLRRPGLADRAAASDRQGQRHHPERRGARDVLAAPYAPTCSSSTRCPTRRWSRWCRSASTPSSRTSRRPRAATPSAP